MDPGNSEMRKRHLSECEPDGCDFMPLSKRINNLHINSSLPSESGSSRSARHGGSCSASNPSCECRLQPSTSSSVVQCSLCNPDLYGIGRAHIPLPDLVVRLPDQLQHYQQQRQQQQQQQLQPQQQQQHLQQQQQQPQHQPDIHGLGYEEHMEEYAPDMDDRTNPHYYGANKLLFSLHIERVKRHGQLFKPNKYDG